MARQYSTYPYEGDDRHSDRWYDQSAEENVLQPGDRFFIPCAGGPSTSRLEAFPPRLEVAESDGVYILEDDGPREQWRYVFVPREH